MVQNSRKCGQVHYILTSQFFMSPFVQLLGKPPIMLPNMKYISPEISRFPHHHQYVQKYMERNYYIKILIGLACLIPETNFHLLKLSFLFPQVLDFEDAGLSSRMVESPGQFFTKSKIKVLPL